MRDRTLLLGLCLLPLLAPLAPAVGASGRAGGEGSGALESGLAALRAELIRADVEFFSDDEMRGRDTPSSGLRVSARFLRARLETLGFHPGGDDDGWFHTFDIHRRRIDPADSRLLLLPDTGEETLLRPGEDYFVGSYRQMQNLTLEGGVVYVGEAKKKELAQMGFGDGEPLWALARTGQGSVNRLSRTVERAGAQGLILVPGDGPNDEDEDGDGVEDDCLRITATATRGSVSLGEGNPGKRVFPVIHLSPSAAERLLSASVATGAASDAAGAEPPWPAPGQRLGVRVREERVGSGTVAVENVAALWPGADPTLRDEVILLSAHYDHVGATGDEIWNGADDNASGSMALLALCEGLAAYGPMRRSVLVLWVSGEEKGLWGSQAWTLRPVLPEGARPVCNVNLDMVGRNAPDELAITPTSAHAAYNGLTRIAEELAPLEGFPVLSSCDEFWSRSDHANFYENLDLPVAFLHAGEHEDYHEPSDTAEKMDYDKIERVTRLVLRMLDAMQTDTLNL